VIAADGIEVATAFALSGREQRGNAVHVARHEPSRVLAECHAKRRIIQLCARALDQRVADPRAMTEWQILCELALPYQWHPQYCDRWRSGPQALASPAPGSAGG
jgi:hypothetical protein